MARTRLALCAFALPLMLACAPELHVAPSDSYHFTENATVEYNGVKLSRKLGTYHQNSANKWITIGNPESKTRVPDQQPKFLVRHTGPFNLGVVRLVREDSSRYTYFWPNPLDISWKLVSPGVTEVTFKHPLPAGEYAFWKVRGDAMPQDENALYQYEGGIFWDFGIED